MVNGDLGVFGLNVQPLVAVVSNRDLGCADNRHSVVMSVWEMVIKLENAVFNLAKVCCLFFLYQSLLFHCLNNVMLMTCNWNVDGNYVAVSAGYPQRAFANVIGNVNGKEFGVAHLYVNISRTGQGTKLDGELHEVPDAVGMFCLKF